MTQEHMDGMIVTCVMSDDKKTNTFCPVFFSKIS